MLGLPLLPAVRVPVADNMTVPLPRFCTLRTGIVRFIFLLAATGVFSIGVLFYSEGRLGASRQLHYDLLATATGGGSEAAAFGGPSGASNASSPSSSSSDCSSLLAAALAREAEVKRNASSARPPAPSAPLSPSAASKAVPNATAPHERRIVPTHGRFLNSDIVCYNKDNRPRIELRSGSYWVLYNYIRASRHFSCEESITYTTHGDHTFLGNLVPLLRRWQGPLSIAVYAPGKE